MEWRLFPGEWYLDAGALLLALAIDIALRELPSALHPVVWMGRLVSLLEKLAPPPGARWAALAWGGVTALALPVVFGGAAWVAANGLRELGPIFYLVGVAVLLNTSFAVKGLAQAANGVRDAMREGSMAEARQGLRSLVSRDPSTLDRSLASAAAIESVAENTTDSYVAPWLAFALLGLPGALAYRAVNTLDSMIGYRGKYERLGKASARLDDVINIVPARISAGMMVVAGSFCRLPVRRGILWCRKGRRLTASPNAGWTIGAMSGLLGVELEKAEHYRIGEGLDQPEPEHIDQAVRVALTVAAMGAVLALGVTAARGLATG